MPKTYFNEDELEEIRKIDLLSYLQSTCPDELLPTTKSTFRYTTRKHDSIELSNGKWCQHSTGIGGVSALDYLNKVEGWSFIDACNHLAGIAPGITLLPAPAPSAHQQARKKLELPKPNAEGNTKAIRYLRSRGIDKSIIQYCIREGLLYEATNGHGGSVVFVGNDENGTPRYGFCRGMNSKFKGDTPGSDKRYSFKLTGYAPDAELHLFEAAIDALSYATLMKMWKQDWRTPTLLSMGGVGIPKKDGTLPAALEQYLTEHPKPEKIRIHFDRDEPGQRAAYSLCAALKSYDAMVAIPPKGKDVNDYLVAQLKEQIARREREMEDR
jgi:hypothetical protein